MTFLHCWTPFLRFLFFLFVGAVEAGVPAFSRLEGEGPQSSKAFLALVGSGRSLSRQEAIPDEDSSIGAASPPRLFVFSVFFRSSSFWSNSSVAALKAASVIFSPIDEWACLTSSMDRAGFFKDLGLNVEWAVIQ